MGRNTAQTGEPTRTFPLDQGGERGANEFGVFLDPCQLASSAEKIVVKSQRGAHRNSPVAN
jgi:hypothetical protein